MRLRTIGENYLRAAPPILSVGALVFGLLRSDRVVLGYGVLAVAFNALNLGLKRAVAAADPPRDSWLRRPAAPPAAGCGEFPGPSCIGDDTIGMPSGHAQFAAMFATYFTLYLAQGPWSGAAALKMLLCWVIAGLVMAQRLQWGNAAACHTPAQVAAGAAFGCVLGAISYAAVVKTDAWW